MKSETRLEPQTQAAPLWATAIATFFGAGRMRPGPGTWGSAATIVLWWLIGRPLPLAVQPWAALALAALATAVGIPAATRVIRATGIKDPSFVVIDEVAGQMLTLVAAPVQWKSLLLGFILFRGFDILKPPPVRRLEHLPEGTGVVVDDLGAGLYALAIMQIVLHYSHWLR